MKKNLIILIIGILFAYSVNAQCSFQPCIFPTGPTTFCAGGSVTIYACTEVAYVWNTGSYNQAITVTTPGEYTVTVTDQNGCTGVSETVYVRYAPHWEKVACGEGHTMAIRSDGTLWAWGYNAYGNLGDGTYADRHVPVQIGTDNNWAIVSCGQGHTMAIKTDGTLWGWGLNSDGQCGTGSTTLSPIPVQIGSDNDWASVSCGEYFTAAIKEDMTLWAWGRNSDGQLGDGTTTGKINPKQIAVGQYFYRVSCGGRHTVAIDYDGTLWAWGYNFLGQLGDGTTINRLSPVQVDLSDIWQSISCGENHTVGLKYDGTLWAWGNNDAGQFGNGTTIGSYTPAQVGIDNDWTGIACADAHTLALKSNGTLWGWGDNVSGALGTGTNFYVNENPILIATQLHVNEVATSASFTAIIKGDGSYVCMTGANTYGQFGNGTTTSSNTFGCDAPITHEITTGIISPLVYCAGAQVSVPFTVDGDYQAGNVFTAELSDAMGNFDYPVAIGTLISGTSGTINGIIPQGTFTGSGYRIRVVVECYAINGSDNGSDILINNPKPTVTANGPTSFCQGGSVTLTSSPRVSYLWNNSETSQSIVVTAPGDYFVAVTDNAGCSATSDAVHLDPTPQWVKVACGVGHTEAIKSDGTLWAWGYNGYGTLGDGTFTNRYTPVQVGSDKHWASVSCGMGHTMAVKTDGSLWGWGYNSYYQLGTGSNTTPPNPVQVGNGYNWVSVSCGEYFSLGIKSDHTLWAWGSNSVGQLGDGTTTTRTVPVQVGIGRGWSSVSCGDYYVHAISTDGTLWAWGSNSVGQLGDGTEITRHSPVQITAYNDWQSVSSGNGYSIGLRSNGTLWAWGDNHGTFGNGTWTPSWTPIMVTEDNDWTSVTCSFFTLAIKSNGTLWAWGENYNGACGYGNNLTYPYPVLIANQADVFLIDNAQTFSAIIKGDGSHICMAGANSWGQLGDGTTTTSYTFNCSPEAVPQITTGVISPLLYCAGTAVSIPFITSKVYPAGNVFTAELSDASGSFNNPVAIGTLNSITSGTINGIIPQGTPSGSGYRIRVSVSCQAVAGTDNGSDITISNPTATVLPDGPTTFCIGANVNLASNAANTYHWSNGGTTQNINVTVSGSYILTITDGYGCSAVSVPTVVTVNPLPTVTMYVSPAAICMGSSAVLTAGGATTYEWNNGLGNGDIKSVTPSLTTSYTVTGTNNNGCINTAINTVTVYPLPTVTLSALPETICQGSSSLLTAGGASTYEWSNGLGSGNTKTVNPATTTFYTVTGTDNNGCVNTATMTITVYPLPTVTLNASPAAICTGSSSILTAGGAITYEWSDGLGSGSTKSVSPSITTSYTITGTDNNGCVNTATITVLVYPLPTVTLNASPASLCLGSSSLLTAGGASTYAWSNGLGNGTTKNVTPATTTTYTVTGTDTYGCLNMATVNIVVHVLPVVTATASPQTGCSGSSSVLTASGALTYAWSNGLGAGNPVTAYPTANTTYYVTGTDVNGCVNTASVALTVLPLPAVVCTASPKGICLGSSSTLTATGGTSYTWSNALGSGSSKSVSPAVTTIYTVTGTGSNGCTNMDTAIVVVKMPVQAFANPAVICKGQSSTLTATGSTSIYTWNNSLGTGSTKIVAPTSTTTYSVTGTTTNGCSNKAGVTVTVNSLPTVTLSASPTAVCLGSSTTLTAGGATTYVWSNGLGTGTPKTVYPTVNTTYTVTGTNANGCANTAAKAITVNPIPNVTMTVNPATICSGSSSALTAGGASSYAWSNSLGTGSSKTVTPASTTTYTVTGTSSAGCSKTATGTVNVNPKPTVTATATPPTITSGQSSSLLAGGASTYVWSNSLGTSNPVTVAPTSTKTYTVTGTSSLGCTGTAKVTVTVTKGSSQETAGVETVTGRINDPVVGCYPNPFNDKTNIFFTMSENEHVKINVFDMTGKLVTVLYDADVAGNLEYKVEFDGAALTSGLFYYRLTTTKEVFTGKIMLKKE